MILTSGKEFNRIRIEEYQGLVVEFQPDGFNAVSGSPTIEFAIGFMRLPSGQVGLTIQLPSGNAYRSKSVFVLLNDKLGSEKLVINGMEFEKL